MKKYTHKQILDFVRKGAAKDITFAEHREYELLSQKEGCLTKIAYSVGVEGVNGLLLKGNRTETYYAVCYRMTALFIFWQEGITNATN